MSPPGRVEDVVIAFTGVMNSVSTNPATVRLMCLLGRRSASEPVKELVDVRVAVSVTVMGRVGGVVGAEAVLRFLLVGHAVAVGVLVGRALVDSRRPG